MLGRLIRVDHRSFAPANLVNSSLCRSCVSDAILRGGASPVAHRSQPHVVSSPESEGGRSTAQHSRFESVSCLQESCLCPDGLWQPTTDRLSSCVTHLASCLCQAVRHAAECPALTVVRCLPYQPSGWRLDARLESAGSWRCLIRRPGFCRRSLPESERGRRRGEFGKLFAQDVVLLDCLPAAQLKCGVNRRATAARDRFLLETPFHTLRAVRAPRIIRLFACRVVLSRIRIPILSPGRSWEATRFFRFIEVDHSWLLRRQFSPKNCTSTRNRMSSTALGVGRILDDCLNSQGGVLQLMHRYAGRTFCTPGNALPP